MRKTLILLFISIYVGHSQSTWKKITPKNISAKSKQIKPNEDLPNKYGLFSLDLSVFKNKLKIKARGINQSIFLPDNNGNISEFTIKETSNFNEELSPEFGFIKSYSVTKKSDNKTTGKLSVGSDGVHLTLYSLDKPTVYLDPHTKDNETYILYSRNDLDHNNRSSHSCNVLGNNRNGKNYFGKIKHRILNDGVLRTYRLALACTGEYAQFHINNQGVRSGTEAEQRAAVLSAMNTTMTRVNGIYERDIAVHMNIVLVGGTNPLINLDPVSDNLDNNDSFALINQNQTLCDNVIGSANYDVGHIFATGNGGIAYFRSVCDNDVKAGAMTGWDSPLDDPFDIDFVAHELGHQFGGNHTFNGDTGSCVGGNRNDETAVEPGSGSTIMAYAGICSPNNVQNNSDDYFHTISVQQMLSFVQNSTPCSVNSNTGNNAPTADAGLDYSVPRRTPLILRGSGSDNDASANLTYCWEQVDNEIVISPPASTSTGGASFRSLSPTTSPNRYLPELETIVSGAFFDFWEVLPEVAREMNFTLTVRDNQSGGGSVAFDNMKISVIDVKPFEVTTPSTEVSWDGATTQTIIWDKSTTDQAPINCRNVRIKLSTDGGVTFPTTIVNSTPNDGIENVIIPNLPTTQARIMIEAVDNIFYNVNSTNFTIIDNPDAGTGDVVDFDNFNLFPNPTSDKSFNLIFDIEAQSNVKIQLFDLRGRLVENKEFNSPTNKFAEQLEYRSVNPGLYLLQVLKDGKKEVRKVIIK
ncbi:reprolysin-like metallopeptidase [uncultured Tenacibaculum sp.]|uniref:reprolysin-like metallopeptidase n=1 Tax=uncultured Tenacibaculum sp. TaxID=174713 RepID=UPI00262875A0|nr:zinc-dependent metalloprotease family protein [uncultured Tenacibaculum sp.]